MLRFGANLSWLFTEYPMSERFKKAKEHGFEGVEILYPLEHPKEVLKKSLEESGAEMLLFNVGTPGEKGLAACPGREQDFRASLISAIDYARALRCKRLHVMAGIVKDMAPEECRKTFCKNLLQAARLVEEDGITLQIEPLNAQDMPGYFLNSMEQAVDIISELTSDFGIKNLALQLDLYHLAKMKEDVISPLPSLLPWTSHVQISDDPGRHEPGSGRLDFPAFFEALERLDYKGWVSCEYRPTGTSEESLKWLREYESKSQGGSSCPNRR